MTAVNCALFGLLPMLLAAFYFAGHHGHLDAFDFHREFWPAARRVLRGLSPYGRNWMDINGDVAFPYPAFTAILFVPLALINHAIADVLFMLLDLAAVAMTLWVLNVRDYRLYGLALVLSPVIAALHDANVTLLLGLGLACLWRSRERPLAAAVLVAVMISLKPFMWPIVVWLLATRRYRALLYTLGCALAINLMSWAVIGFDQINSYSRVLSDVDRVMDRRGYSVTALVMHLGGGRTVSYVFAGLLAAAVCALCVAFARRGDQKTSFALSIAACLLATPVLWDHYFALLLVPLALYRPRLDRLWLLPIVFWVSPGVQHPELWQVAVALLASAAIFGRLMPGSRSIASPGLDLAEAVGLPPVVAGSR